jgi:threonine synthase
VSRDGKQPRLRCTACGAEHPWSLTQLCDSCQGLVEVEYDPALVELRSEGPPMERFFDLLPLVSRENIIDGGEGNTPCRAARELGRALGLENLWVKIEGTNPTRTTKDRQGSVAVAALRELGVQSFAMSSTGNSCTAVARIASRVPDLQVHIFVGDEFLERVDFADAPNITVYHLRDGTYVEAGMAAAWFSRESGIPMDRGFFSFPKREALKSVFLEAVAQVTRPIDFYVQGVSSGMGVYATHRAAQQLRAIGHIDRAPRLVCVQEETCDPLVRSFNRGAERLHPDDVIRQPRGLSKATLRGDPTQAYPYTRGSVLDTGGTMASVGQDEMRAMRALLLETEGIDACFTSAMTVAAARQLRGSGFLPRDATVLLNLTGADRPDSAATRADFVVERDGDAWKVTAAEGEKPEGELQQVIEVVRRSQRLKPEEPLDAATVLLDRGLALDSVALLELLLGLEKRFTCRIEDGEVTPENFSTIGAVVELIRRKKSGDDRGR